VRDLFERFLPEEKRVKKLGTSIDPASILTLQGDAAAGRRLFFQEGAAQCAQCHRLENQGRDFGPDLSLVGRKYDRSQMLEHLLKPSLFIDPAYINHSVETRDEASYTGFVTRRTPDEIVLKNVEAQEVRLPSARIKQITTSEISAMPEGLLQTLTAQQAADLLEYLTTLR
jgi:putative heme-binding domain-containing protein